MNDDIHDTVWKYDTVDIIRMGKLGTLFIMIKDKNTKYILIQEDEEMNLDTAQLIDVSEDDVKLMRLLFE